MKRLCSLRLARGYTGRQMIVRIDGQTHGGHDYALGNSLAANIDRDNVGDRLSLVKHASAVIPLLVDETLYFIPWNKAEVFEKLCREHGHEIAPILMNFIDYNNGCISPSSEYIHAIRRICDEHGMVFIIDEIPPSVRTGMPGGHGYYGVMPGLCLFGKALTNGVPVAVVAGKGKVVTKMMDPINPVVPGGTFFGNLLGCAAGIEALTITEKPFVFDLWLKRTAEFYFQVHTIFDETNFPAIEQGLGCTFGIYGGTREPVSNYHHISERTNFALRKAHVLKCIEKGLPFHTNFTISAQHDEKGLAQSLDILHDCVFEIKSAKVS